MIGVVLFANTVGIFLFYPFARIALACFLVSSLVSLSLFAVFSDLFSDSVRIFIVIFTCSLIGILILCSQYYGKIPRIPDPDDVGSVSISAGVSTFPRAPVAPLVGDITAYGSKWFHDSMNRTVLFRGVNLAGSSKLPTRYSTNSPLLNYAKDEKNVSFVGRPFPLDQANIHLGRLRSWGFTLLRFIVTWEAIEHEGPGIYDFEYLEYLVKILRKCKEFGMSVVVDVHQDTWSRWTGGDGAPSWTLEKIGLDIHKLNSSGAAVLENYNEPLPDMVWPSSNFRLAAGTMWTLFFAGNEFAPKSFIDGQPVQEYLQERYCDMLNTLAKAIKNETNVIGIDLLNEPNVGFVGTQDMRDISRNNFFIGWRVGVWSAILLGVGIPQRVSYFKSFLRYAGKRWLNSKEDVAWSAGKEACLWRTNGVWDFHPVTGKPVLNSPFYFSKLRCGREINFTTDFAMPFWRRATEVVRIHMPETIIFIEPVLDLSHPEKLETIVLDNDLVGPGGFVWARHWYDGMTLLTRNFNRFFGINAITRRPVFGTRGMEESYGKGICKFAQEASKMGKCGSPVLIGECGIPFNMVGSCAFVTGDFFKETLALNTSMRALENALVSYTLWTYTPNNTNCCGDGWNGEDLSIFSQDQMKGAGSDNLYNGGRALHAAIRPFPMRTAGTPVKLHFDPYRSDRRFIFVFTPHFGGSNDTIIFLPSYHYPHGAVVDVSYSLPETSDSTAKSNVESCDCTSYNIDWDEQTLVFNHSTCELDKENNVRIVVTKKGN